MRQNPIPHVIFCGFLLLSTLACGKENNGSTDEGSVKNDSQIPPMAHREDVKNDSQSPPMARRRSEHWLTAEQFCADFEKLEWSKLRDKYQAKVIELKGIVKGFNHGRNEKEEPEIQVITPGNDKDEVRCFFSERFRPWARYAKGQEVTIKGFMRDAQGLPMLSECEVANAGPSTAVVMTAEEYAKEYATSGESIAKKYENKSLLITGEIVEIGPQGKTRKVVHLKGIGKKIVACSVNADDIKEEQLKKLPPGTKIKLYCEFASETPWFFRNCELISDLK